MKIKGLYLFFAVLNVCCTPIRMQTRSGELKTIGYVANLEDLFKESIKKEQKCLTDDYIWPQYQRDAQHTGYSPYHGPQKGKPPLVISFENKTSYLMNNKFPSMDSQGRLYLASGKDLFILEGKNLFQKRLPLLLYHIYYPVMPILDLEENVYFHGLKATYRLKNGKFFEFYSHNYPAPATTLPVIDCDGTVYLLTQSIYFDIKHGVMICAHPKNKKGWCVRLPGNGLFEYAVPAIGRMGEIYVVTGGDAGALLTALDPSGKIIWTNSFQHPIDGAPTVGFDGTIYFGSSSGFYYDAILAYFYAVSPSGEILWRYPINGAQYIEGSPAVSPKGIIYFVANNNRLYAMSKEGNLLWWYNPVSGFVNSSPIIDADGTVYYADHQQVIAISSKGKLKWQYILRYSSPYDIFSIPIISKDHALYIRYERNIYIFKD